MDTTPSTRTSWSLAVVWREHPFVMATVAALGLIVGSGLFMLVNYFDAADEPPIRVKNGSLELEIPLIYGPWKQNGDARHWKTSGKTRKSTDLSVMLTVASGVACQPKSGIGGVLTVKYSDNQTVTIDGTKKHTHVVGMSDLVLDSAEHALSYKAAGYISDITLASGATTVLTCHFSKATDLADLWIFD